MALVKAKVTADREPITYINDIAAKIQRRRYQILVHSLLYYELDVNIVSDAQWSAWATELAQLQKQNPDISNKVIFAEAFAGFDGSTGFNLPYTDAQVINIAYRLLTHCKSAESADALYKLQYGLHATPAEYERYKRKCHSCATQTTKNKEVRPVEQKQRKGLFSVARK